VNKTKFNDLLPGSIKDDPKLKVISECIDNVFAKIRENIPNLIIFARIDSLDESTLDDLAWEWNLNHYDGYNLLTDIQEKRDLVKNAIRLKKYKGTRWALERIGEILNMPITLIEWWENFEYGTGMLPYEFDVFVDANQRGVTDEFYINVMNLVKSLKNARSHIRKIQSMLLVNATLFLGTTSLSIQIKTVFPEFFKEMDVPVNQSVAILGHHVELVKVYPEFFKKMQVPINKHLGILHYSASIIIIYPDRNSDVSQI